MSGDPASHVEPVHGSFGWGAVFSVQQHQLLLGTHCTSFQHTLQLEGRHQAQMFLNILYSSLSPEWSLHRILSGSPEKYCKLVTSRDYTSFKSTISAHGQVCELNFVFGNYLRCVFRDKSRINFRRTLIVKFTIICEELHCK